MFSFSDRPEGLDKHKMFKGGNIIIRGFTRKTAPREVWEELISEGFSAQEAVYLCEKMKEFYYEVNKNPELYKKMVEDSKKDWR
jgi:hypothetical protein